MTALYVCSHSGGLPRLLLRESYSSYTYWRPFFGVVTVDKSLYRRCAGPGESIDKKETHQCLVTRI